MAHTTSPRGSGFEIALPVGFLTPGVFDAQNLVTIPNAKLVRRLGTLSPGEMAAVKAAVKKWLGMGAVSS